MFVEINCHMAHGPAQINLDTRHNAQTGSVYVLTFLIQHSLAEFILLPFGADHHVNTKRTAVNILQRRLHNLDDALSDSGKLSLANERFHHFHLIIFRAEHIARIGILDCVEERKTAIEHLAVLHFKLHGEISHLII